MDIHEIQNYAEQARSNEQIDSDSRETDTKISVENLYYSWLGMVADLDGKWVRDNRLKRLMNEECASMLLSEIQARFNDNMNYSELTEQQITEMSSMTSEYACNRMKYKWGDYEIDVDDLIPISSQIEHSLIIWLNIAKLGGMKLYKVRRGQITIHKTEHIQSPVS